MSLNRKTLRRLILEELENKLKDERKHHKKGWDRIRHDEEKDWEDF